MATGRKKKCCKSGVSASGSQEFKRSTKTHQIIADVDKKTNFFKASRRRKFVQRNRFRQFIRQLQRTSNRLVFDSFFFFSFANFLLSTAAFLTFPILIIIIIIIEIGRKKKKHGCRSIGPNERTNAMFFFYFVLCRACSC